MIKTAKFKLSGLICIACEKVVTKRLKTIGGIQEIKVNVKNGDVLVSGDRLIGKNEVAQALQGTHYQVVNEM